ncbi:MAG TPA: TIGR02452 family protein [Leptospiraceae bacterium]|nr:TIGR02452 family protein [Leptospiraceae bacterium]HRG76083.1 TIGR02452 family protein [Leptospiraceae bacterium]
MSQLEKENNKSIAKENSDIFSKGYYATSDGSKISVKDNLEYAVKNSMYFKDSDFTEIDKRLRVETAKNRNTKIEITGESTFQGARRILEETGQRVVVLNFASATNPGGGYLNGARAQEEDLCRTSGLYPCLSQFIEFYQFHRDQKSFLYSDRMMYSPDVPVFRDDSMTLQKKIYKISVITSAAPAMIDVAVGDTESFIRGGRALDLRIEKLLSLMLSKKYTNIILGAWGCGAFLNDPKVVSKLFKKHLTLGGRFENKFERVLFAIRDNKTTENRKIFSEQFGINN